jgi:hypothetical protein
MSTSNRPGGSRKPKRPRRPKTPEPSSVRCPSCDSDRVRPIVYGLPSEDLMEEASREQVLLGGCTIFHDRPSLACLGCGGQWS